MQAAANLKRRILVVDDEPDVANVVELMLRFDGHDVQVITSGKQALMLLAQIPFDIVILDYVMPDMKGDELAALIKQTRPQQMVIMLSAHADLINTSEMKVAGVDFFLSKPFLLEDLRTALLQCHIAEKVPTQL
jgi:two-component system OmpR family response regulator